MLMREWSQQHEHPWTDFFREVNTNQLTRWIQTGRISPWVLYNARSADDALARCTPEQISMIANTAPVAQWSSRFKTNAEGATFARDTLRKAGL